VKKLGIFLAVILGLAAAYHVFGGHTYRYRVTIDVEVNGKVLSASSVNETRFLRQPQLLGVPPYAITHHAEAVYLDLGSGRNVVATLGTGPTGDGWGTTSLVGRVFDIKKTEEFWTRLAASNEERELSGELLPTLVTFTDPSDPKTARVVMPGDFPKVFGQGVRFLGARIQMTRDPVTEKIETELLWIPMMKEQLKGRGETGHPAVFNVVPSLFVRRN
jgi:hypothetical protein